MQDIYQASLEQLKANSQFRSIPSLSHQRQLVTVQNNDNEKILSTLINVASNDYLGMNTDSELQAEFLDYIYQLPVDQRPRLGSTSSRLLTGNDSQLELLESELEHWYNLSLSDNNDPTKQNLLKSALVFNSGYHGNLGILPALSLLPAQKGNTLILADKLVHASIIDGILLATLNSRCSYKRYRHNDHQHLRTLIANAGENISRIIIVTESIFSMDGDLADLADLVTIKKSDSSTYRSSRIELYVDEAHSVGVLGETGLGLAEATTSISIADIDYLIGTFGKAFSSMGAYLMCHPVVRDWLVNSMRPLIYSTALPPMTHAWSRFVLKKIPHLQTKRQYLAKISTQMRQVIEEKTEQVNPSRSPIVPYILGSNQKAIDKSQQLKIAGFYALAIRPPTVPTNTARIRLVMNAGMDTDICQRLIESL